ncbi:alpha-amylase family protein [Comamonas testosteroni]|uniref:alpha-amylase family protein n=1 Tax=Comamonas testosteroni TaxID=285 RepID=UPI002DBEE988|nr:alpha-amylase family protein [Comamonas testosteroni]MEB5967384.1 beta-galactosidase [Comamonas testosteroni]
MSQENSVDVTRGWWNKPYSNVQTNIQEIDATMDVERVLDFIQSHGADSWLLNVGGIASFYPSDLPYQPQTPFLRDRPSRDLIGDAISAARKRNIRVLARMDFSKVYGNVAAQHPEWLFVSPSGKPQIYNTLYSTCPNGDYYQKKSFEIIDEVMDRYEISGLFVNWFKFSEVDYSRVYHGVCHCENCKVAFSKYAPGIELPDGPAHANYARWLQFSASVVQDLTNRLARHVAEKGRDAAMIMSRESPIIYYEANNAFGRELWPHATGEAVSVYRTGMPASSVLVNSACFVDMPYRMAGEQPELFAQYLLQAIARGGNPSTYMMGAPGRIDYPSHKLAGEIQSFFLKNRSAYGSYRPGSKVALLRPSPLRKADAGYAASVAEYRGIYSALKEQHIPFDVLGTELVARMWMAGDLCRYSTVIVPDIVDIGAEAGVCLDSFVNAGGNVILTGKGGVASDGSVELSTAPSVMRSGEMRQGMDLWATYVADLPQPNAREYQYEKGVVPVFGGYTSYIWRPSSIVIGKLLPQAPYGPPEKCYGHIPTDEPAAVAIRSGSGNVLQIPWSIGQTYHEFGITSVRDCFFRMVGQFLDAPVSATLPEQVELIVGENDEGLLLHLLNQTGARRKSFGPHVKVRDGRICVHGGVQAKSLVTGKIIESNVVGDDLHIQLPDLELYDVISVTK